MFAPAHPIHVIRHAGAIRWLAAIAVSVLLLAFGRAARA
jgi:hypothetical protein